MKYSKRQLEESIAYWETALRRIGLAESNAEKVIGELLSLNESEKVDSDDRNLLKKSLSEIEDWKDLDQFIKDHEMEVKNKAAELDQKQKGILSKAWDLLKKIAGKTKDFILDHWFDILTLVALIILAVLGYNRFIAPLAKCAKQFDTSAKWMMAPGEMLQQKAVEMGEKPISDGYAHFINQISNLD